MELRFAVIFAVLLASLAAPSIGHPVKRSAWRHPCGHSIRADKITGNHEIRHGFSKLLRAVRTQIGVANKYFKNEEKNINITYHQVRGLKEELYRYDWLPQKQFDWYKKGIRCLDKTTKINKVLQAFHSALQNFSVTFEELKKFNRTDIYPEGIAPIRSRIVEGMAQLLIQILCEVEWALESLNVSIPERVKEDFFSKREKWDPSPDNTGSLIQDWGVISLYKKFLTDWLLIMDKVNKKTVCKSPEIVTRRKKKTKH